MAKKKAATKAIRARRAAAAVAVLALGAGTLWMAPAGTTADPGGGSGAPAAAEVEQPGASGRSAGFGVGDPGGVFEGSATDSRSPAIVGDGPGASGERVAGGALLQSATDSRSPTID